MQVEAIPLTDFTHDDLNMRRGHVRLIDEHLARDFETRGLVRIKLAAFVPRVVTPLGNSLAGGAAQPSAASPPAPASNSTTTPTAKLSVRGPANFRKRGR